MRLLEKILAVGVLISLILKFNMIAGGDISLMAFTMALTVIYYPLGFLFFNQIRLRDVFKKAAYKNTTAFSIILASVTGIGLSTICIGSLFKLFHLSGANEMLIVGLTTTLIVSLVALIVLIRNNYVFFGKYILTRTLIIGGASVVLFVIY